MSAEKTSLPDLITENELAALLGKNVITLRRWYQRRIGPPRIMLGRTPVYRREALTDWLLKLEKKGATR